MFAMIVCHKALTCIGHHMVVVAAGLHRTVGAVVLVGFRLRSNREFAVVDFAYNRDNQIHTAEILVFRTMDQSGQKCRYTFRVAGIHSVARLACRRKDFYLVTFVFGKTAVVDSLADMGADRMIPTPAAGSWWVGEA